MTTEHGSILLVDDDLLPARALARELTKRGWSVQVAQSGHEALAMITPDLRAVLVDLHMPSMDGVQLIQRLREQRLQSLLFLTSAQLTTAATVQAVRAGAEDVLEKPLDAVALHARLLRAAKPSSLPNEASEVTATILGSAPAVRAVREQIRTVARYRDLPVLIMGETGTGKELVAQAVHGSSETDGPFVPVNCAAIPEHLFESELFGHDAGAFTGARGARVGLFEAAADGTLFLDEVGELPSALQPKLLRALETRSFRRVGSSRDLPFRARIVSATHRPLNGADTTLRSDLYYRLAGFTISTPALRDRCEDIQLLATHFLRQFGARYSVRLSLSPRALEALHAYDWPGNVRELRAVVQQAAVLTQGGEIGVAELMTAFKDRQQSSVSSISLQPALPPAAELPSTDATPSAQEPLRDLERRTILQTWSSSGQNLSAAARALGLPRTTLRDRLRKYGVR